MHPHALPNIWRNAMLFQMEYILGKHERPCQRDPTQQQLGSRDISGRLPEPHPNTKATT